MLSLRSLSRRAALVRLGGGGLAATLAVRGSATASSQSATPVTNGAAPLPDGITAIIEQPRYAFAR